MLDRKIFIDLSKKPSHLVGRKARDGEQPDIVLGGIGVQPKHA